MAMQVLRANGLEIAYERAGQGPPLVLAHGAAVDSRMWRPQVTALADEFTVVAWDEPGAVQRDRSRVLPRSPAALAARRRQHGLTEDGGLLACLRLGRAQLRHRSAQDRVAGVVPLPVERLA
jgi:pimeloyl-ACP methyl ester carboxylesterase